MSSKSANTERLKSKINYALYCVNIFGSGLKTIKDELKRQINSGLRQTVFVLDLEDLQEQILQEQSNAMSNKKHNKDYASSPNLMPVILNHIQEILKHHDSRTKKINEELKFDLYEYWQKQGPASKAAKPDKSSDIKSDKETGIVGRKEKQDMSTSSLVVKEHNRIGNTRVLGTRKYIKDAPDLEKLYIIILGQMSISLLMDLLRLHQPVQAIINFVPTESNYDVMLGNNTLRNFILSTLAAINNSISNLRQEIISKPIGLFTHRLPVISNCMATAKSREIFDQLTWCIYDTDILKQQYENYYFKPFQVTDVEIPAGENLTQLYHVAESLSIRGRFQKSPLPTTVSDFASIAAYLNSLLSACVVQEDVVTERRPRPTNSLLPNAFSTITNICKFDRLIIAENNNLLLNMLKYANLDDFQAVYLCCLDYNEVGKFAISHQQETVVEAIKRVSDCKPELPQYVKYYANKECSWQRIAELKQQYDEYEIRGFRDGFKMYIFRRKYHVLKEWENSVIIPTRLCFRDFTLFQTEEFLKDLITPKKLSSAGNEKIAEAYELDKNIFVRPNSLKADTIEKQLNEKISKRKSEARSKRRSGKDAYISKPTSVSEETQGLPSGHHLLQGYNLDDTLQEVKCKTSKYNFVQGCIQLYEEKLCFQETNKQLSVHTGNTSVFFSGACNQPKGISNNVRLVTEDNIGIRVLNADNECSRVVLNYSNGLSIYCHTNHCEQIWYCDSTPRDEQKRIVTNFGAIIVFFKSQHVKIMRYNGEVYMLYQHEFGSEEHGEGLANKSSELTASNFQKQKQPRKKLSKHSTTSSQSKTSPTSEESINIHSTSKSSTSNWISALKFELDFFNFLCAFYGLTYLRFSITTSRGRVIHVSQQGEFFENCSCSINEWFDYFANEAYCERSDGVKLIWGPGSMKCFHEDGTVFTSAIEEDYATAHNDEYESQSSSHKEFSPEIEESFPQLAFETPFFDSNRTSAINGEVYTPCDDQFVHLKCRHMFMQHPSYAAVFIHELGSNSQNLEIFGTNGIRIYTQKEECNDNGFEIDEDLMEVKSKTKLMINVCIHKNVKVCVADESCKVLVAIIPNEERAESDSLCLSLKYTANIQDVFNDWVKEIDTLKRCEPHECRELYFMEKINYDSNIRGFEFMSMLPTTTSPYKYRKGNNIVELKGLDTINNTMLGSGGDYDEDRKQLPRFKQRNKEKCCQNPENGLPSSLCANVFIEIPQQLRNLKNITKFLEPFENICFKSLRCKFKDALNCYLRPQFELCVKVVCSRINWKKRQREHDRRLFNEKQRSGLYIAMIKHKKYPNYWKFSQAYGNNVQCIEFFDFVQNQCNCECK